MNKISYLAAFTDKILKIVFSAEIVCSLQLAYATRKPFFLTLYMYIVGNFISFNIYSAI